jgi:uncharacterized membrane protein (DUF106 family)
MWDIVSTIDKTFDFALLPFQSLNPFWPLLFFSLLLGVFMLIVFRRTSDQKQIKEIKDRIKAHVFELSIFKDDVRILLSALKNVVLYNMKYMRHFVRPMLFMAIPLVFVLVQLEGWFGYRPLKPGESTIVSVKTSEGREEEMAKAVLEAEKGLTVETPPLRIPGEEVDWRVRADEPGEHTLTLTIGEQVVQKKVIVSSDGSLARVSPGAATASLVWGAFLNSKQESPLVTAAAQFIEVEYPSRAIKVLGWELHWLLMFFVLSTVFTFALKGFFRVEI